MKPKGIIELIVLLAVAGMLFSGYLTYYTFTTGIAACELFFFGLPSCFYGLLMYIGIFLSSIGMRMQFRKAYAADKKMLAISVISVVGIGFALFLTLYVLNNPSCAPLYIFGIPPCVLGLVMYTLVFVLAALGACRLKGK